MTRKIYIISFLSLVSLLLLSTSCENNVEKDYDINNDILVVENNNTNIKISQLLFPANNSLYTIGDSILFEIEQIQNIKIDSVVIFAGKTHITTLNAKPFSYYWHSGNLRTGKNIFKIIAYHSEGKKDKNTISINFKSDIVPTRYTVKVIRKFSHNKNAYTQGLIYENGYIYEGTGQFGKSSLQKYKLSNHEIVQSYNNASDIFGEGIIITGDKLIQLTWQSGKGFIYDKETFRQTGKFNFQTEGWGLTTDGEKLLMSDGSNKIYFLETGVFTKIDEIEVYNNFGKVSKLNELEYINGLIYANIYRADIDRIVMIDPLTGKVVGIINANNIRPPNVPRHPDYVLNGIAWNTKTNRLLLTGKYWPNIFEVEIVEE